MANTAQVTLRMPAGLKKEAACFFANCGVNFNQGIILVLQEALNKGSITLTPRYNSETLAAMREADEIIANPESSKSYSCAAEMLQDILADDCEAENSVRN